LAQTLTSRRQDLAFAVTRTVGLSSLASLVIDLAPAQARSVLLCR
jgi:hypothetical protein